MDLFLLYQYVISFAVGALFINFLFNLFLFKDISKYKLDKETIKEQPLVSVLIPARNEGRNIEKCLKSLLKQNYQNYEIIVLNDNSTDNTEKIVKKIMKFSKNVRLIKGEKLAQGWLGKNFACHQLSRMAKGQYFIFTDADTIHKKNSISSSLACILEDRLDVLCPFPRQIMITVHERMIVSFMNFAILLFLPLALIRKSKNPLFCTGVGQYFLFKREAYFGMGGHNAVKGKILEDVHISKKVKEAGYRYMIFDGSKIVSCRMYKGFKEVWRGYSRFLFSAFDYKIFMMATVFSLVIIFLLLSFLFLPLGLFIYNWPREIIILLIIQTALISLIKILIAMKLKERIFDFMLHPFSIIYITIIAVNSYLQSRLGDGISWKGRTYQASSKNDDLEIIEDKANIF